MKTMMMILMMMATFQISVAQEILPASVLNSFSHFYPHIEEVNWVANEKLQYEATFDLGESVVIATFGLDGTWLGERANVSMEDLPGHINKTLLDEYEGHTLVYAEKVDTYMDITFYKVGIHYLNEDWDILFSDNGEIVMEEKVYDTYLPIKMEGSKVVKR